MSILSRWRATLRATLRRDALDRDLDRELSQWVDELAARYEGTGLSPAEARRRALVDTGGLEQVKECVRDARPRVLGAGLLQDAIYASRSLWRTPGLFAAITVTLALGIGANTAIYSIVHSVLIQQLPYHAPERLTLLFANMGAARLSRIRLAGPEVIDFQKGAPALSGVAAVQPASAAITGDGDPEQVRIARITPNFLDVLGVVVARGRGFSADDGPRSPVSSVIVSWLFFQRRFGGDAAAVGRRIALDGGPATVIGVLPEHFRFQLLSIGGFPDEPQIFQPFQTDLADGHRLIRPYNVVARIADGSTLEEASRQVAAVGAELARHDHVYRDAKHTFYLTPLAADSTRTIRPVLLGLLAAVLVVLLVSCVNVGGLLLARAAGRRREVATLVALGADRVRLARQFVIEGLLVAGAGALAGVVTGRAALRAIVALRPPTLDRLQYAAIDARVLGVVAAISCVWGLLFALAPLTEFARLTVSGNLQHSSRTTGRIRYRTRSALVVVQIALGTVLAISAGLLVRTVTALQRVDAGFDLESPALTFRVAWPAGRYPTRAQVNAFSRELEARLSALPHVRHAGAMTHLPFDTVSSWTGKYVTEARNTPAGIASAPFTDMRAVSPGLLPALGARLAAGRWFNEDDDWNGEPVSIVDEQLAARAWPGAPAVGQRLRVPYEIDRSVAAIWTTVVGVVRPIRYRTLDGEAEDQAYVPVRQVLREGPMAYVVRTDGDPRRLEKDVRAAVASLDPLLPAYDIRPLDTYVTRALSARTFTAVLTASFAFLALALVAVGLGGLVGYSVASRHREFGVRLALGATPARVRRRVLAEALLLVGTGVTLGIACATATANAIRTLLFGVEPLDAATYAGAVLLFCFIGLAASWWPARRASGVNPAEALRAE
jgi:predicted permease